MPVHRRPSSKAAAVAKPVSAGAAARILVEDDGLYAVTADAIAAALGTNLQQARSLIGKYQLRLQQGGQPVAWMADPGNERLYFYGQAPGARSASTRATTCTGSTWARAWR